MACSRPVPPRWRKWSVDATAYLLQAGQGVPGTSWHVESVAVDRVVLSRHAGMVAADTEAARKVFALPALR